MFWLTQSNVTRLVPGALSIKLVFCAALVHART